MIDILKSATFENWLLGLRDRQARFRIQARIDRLRQGNPGDAKPVGHGISELRMDYGPGYRVYYMQRGAYLIVLLAGGDKRSQESDIELAHSIANQWKE